MSVPNYKPTEVLTPDAVELQELKEQVNAVLWAPDTPQEFIDVLEHALLMAHSARCLAERGPND